MLLAKVNYLCGVSPGVGERHFSSDLESQLHIKKSQPESRIHSPLAFTTRSKTVWKPPKTSEELYIKNTRSSSLTQHSVWTKHTHKTSLLLLYWKRKRQANGLQDSCVDTFHLSHRSENRRWWSSLKMAFKAASYSWPKTPDVPRFLSSAFPTEITQLWFIKTLV